MPMKKAILTAGIVALFLALCLAVIFLLPEDGADEPAHTTAENLQYLFDLNHVDHITKLSFTYREKPTVSLSKEESGWQVTDRAGLPIAPAAMEGLLSDLEQILAIRIITENCIDPTEYGMDAPTLKLTISEEHGSKTYLFGSYNSHFKGYYCMVEGMKVVALLEESYLLSYTVALTDLLAAEKMPVLALPPAVAMTDSNGAAVELSSTETAELGNLLSGIRIDRLIDWGTEKYAAYGLDTPTVFATTREDGSPLTLRFAKGESDELVYLVIDDKELIYLVTCEDMDALMGYLR